MLLPLRCLVLKQVLLDLLLRRVTRRVVVKVGTRTLQATQHRQFRRLTRLIPLLEAPVDLVEMVEMIQKYSQIPERGPPLRDLMAHLLPLEEIKMIDLDQTP